MSEKTPTPTAPCLSIEPFEHQIRGPIYRVMLQCGKQRLSRLANTWAEAMAAAREVGHALGLREVHTSSGKVML